MSGEATREKTIREEVIELEIPEEVKQRIVRKIEKAEQGEINKDFENEQRTWKMQRRFESEVDKERDHTRAIAEECKKLEEENTILKAKMEVVEMIFGK